MLTDYQSNMYESSILLSRRDSVYMRKSGTHNKNFHPIVRFRISSNKPAQRSADQILELSKTLGIYIYLSQV